MYWRINDDDSFEIMSHENEILVNQTFSLQLNFENYKICLNNVRIKRLENRLPEKKMGSNPICGKRESIALGPNSLLKEETHKNRFEGYELNKRIKSDKSSNYENDSNLIPKQSRDEFRRLTNPLFKTEEYDLKSGFSGNFKKRENWKIEGDKLKIMDPMEDDNKPIIEDFLDELVFPNKKPTVFAKLAKVKEDKTIHSPKQLETDSVEIIQKENENLVTFCAICYQVYSGLKAFLPTCKHTYCPPCIKEWSQQTNHCPLCKQKFNEIWIYQNDLLLKKEIVKDAQYVHEYMETSEDEIIANADNDCYVCERDNNPNNLLICDHCKKKCCHTSCLRPRLRYIPQDEWYCDFCVREHNLATQYPIAGIFNGRRLNRFIH